MLADVLRRFGLGKLAGNTIISTFWQCLRIAGQALWVIMIARALGAPGYGAFAGIAGLATTLGGFAGLGTGLLLLQNVSRDHAMFGAHWRKATLTTLASGLVLVVFFCLVARPIAGSYATLPVIAAIGLSELVCYPLVYVAGFAFQSHERLGWSGALATLMSGARLLAIVVFWFSAATMDLATYAWFHLGASVVTAMCALGLVRVLLRSPRARFELRASEVREGLSFSAVWFTGNALTELDKTLALRFAGSEIAGVYSAAYRLVSALTLPVASLALAAQPRLFRKGADPADGNPRLVRHLALVAAAYGSAASIVLLVLAGLLPVLLGHAFESATKAARLLALVPPLFSLRLIGNTVLMTSGRQLVRVAIEILGVLLLIGLASVWMPEYGVEGVAMTVTATEAALAATVWAVLWSGKRGHRAF